MLKNQIKIGKKVFTVKKEYLKMLNRYKNNKKVSIGKTIQCSTCLDEFEKKKESYVFCSIQCKDDFWNKIDPRKRNNNGKNRGKTRYKQVHWCDDDWADNDYHGGGH